MTIFRIPEQHVFPQPELAEPDGLLGVGGDLNPHRVVLAYQNGIFPWYSEGQPILWWSPDPRMVLDPKELRISRSLKKTIRKTEFRISFDEAFDQVLEHCAATPRAHQSGTWITEEMKSCYQQLHKLGWAHSCEAWQGDDLVGGLYGISAGQLFCGESMFAHAPDASKIAFVTLVRHLQNWGVPLVDCQVHTDHLARFGAKEIPRDSFLKLISPLVSASQFPHPWRVNPHLDPLATI